MSAALLDCFNLKRCKVETHLDQEHHSLNVYGLSSQLDTLRELAVSFPVPSVYWGTKQYLLWLLIMSGIQ